MQYGQGKLLVYAFSRGGGARLPDVGVHGVSIFLGLHNLFLSKAIPLLIGHFNSYKRSNWLRPMTPVALHSLPVNRRLLRAM